MRPNNPRVLKILLLSALLCFVTSAPSVAQEQASEISSPAKAYLQQALDLMQENALHKKSIDWAQVRKETLARAKGAQTTSDTYPAIIFALSLLQENHSRLQIPDSLIGEKRQAIIAAIAKIKGSPRTDSMNSPFSPQKEMQGHMDRYKDQAFAHVVVPMCLGPYPEWEKNGPYFQEFAEKLHSIVIGLQSQKPQGWIIDLRGNSGGNMWPMLAGVGLLIGEGDLGTFISADDERVPWFYRSGKAGTRTPDGKEYISSEVKQPPFAFPDLPWVAVLFDRGTGSSGEAIAISLAGRPRERSFGEHTAGFSTSNQMYPLPDGASMFLCVGVETDRTSKLYPDGLEPDAKIPPPEARPAEENDAALLAAEQWLAEQTALTAPPKESQYE